MTLTQIGEYRYWDHTEAVRVEIPRPTLAHGAAVIELEIAQRGNLDRRAQFFNGTQLRGNETLWRLPVELLEGCEPNSQTKITDDWGRVYLVKTAVRLGTGDDPGHWECLTVEQK